MNKILVLCTGNSCRSQMLHGFLKQKANLEVYSAGVETHGVNPLAIKVMGEIGIDIGSHTSNHVDEYHHIKFDTVITVCDNAKERCPIFPAESKKIHHNFEDPAKAEGSKEDILEKFRQVRDEIEQFAKGFES